MPFKHKSRGTAKSGPSIDEIIAQIKAMDERKAAQERGTVVKPPKEAEPPPPPAPVIDTETQNREWNFRQKEKLYAGLAELKKQRDEYKAIEESLLGSNALDRAAIERGHLQNFKVAQTGAKYDENGNPVTPDTYAPFDGVKDAQQRALSAERQGRPHAYITDPIEWKRHADEFDKWHKAAAKDEEWYQAQIADVEKLSKQQDLARKAISDKDISDAEDAANASGFKLQSLLNIPSAVTGTIAAGVLKAFPKGSEGYKKGTQLLEDATSGGLSNYLDTMGGVTADASAGLAKEAGLGETGQTIAGIAGGVLLDPSLPLGGGTRMLARGAGGAVKMLGGGIKAVEGATVAGKLGRLSKAGLKSPGALVGALGEAITPSDKLLMASRVVPFRTLSTGARVLDTTATTLARTKELGKVVESGIEQAVRPTAAKSLKGEVDTILAKGAPLVEGAPGSGAATAQKPLAISPAERKAIDAGIDAYGKSKDPAMTLTQSLRDAGVSDEVIGRVAPNIAAHQTAANETLRGLAASDPAAFRKAIVGATAGTKDEALIVGATDQILTDSAKEGYKSPLIAEQYGGEKGRAALGQTRLPPVVHNVLVPALVKAGEFTHANDLVTAFKTTLLSDYAKDPEYMRWHAANVARQQTISREVAAFQVHAVDRMAEDMTQRAVRLTNGEYQVVNTDTGAVMDKFRNRADATQWAAENGVIAPERQNVVYDTARLMVSKMSDVPAYERAMNISPVESRVARDIADRMNKSMKFHLEFANNMGVPIADFADDVMSGLHGYDPQSLWSEQMQGHLLSSASARDIIRGGQETGRYGGRGGIDVPTGGMRAKRTWRNATAIEKADAIRKDLNLPADFPVFENNPQKLLRHQFGAANVQIERTNRARSFVEEFGTHADPNTLLAGNVAAATAQAKTPAEIRTALEAQGVPLPTHGTSALEFLQSHKAAIPEDVEQIVKLLTTEMPAPHREFFLSMATPAKPVNAVVREWDAFVSSQRRAVLSRWPGLGNDFVGNVGQAMLTDTDPKFFNEALRIIREGEQNADYRLWKSVGVVNEGLIADTRLGEQVGSTTARPSAFRSGKPSLLKRAAANVSESVTERGYLGAATRGVTGSDKLGKAVSKVVGAPLKLRQEQDNVFRLAHALTRRAEGMGVQAAAKSTHGAWGNFTEFTKFEKGAARQWFFFWAWKARAMRAAGMQFLIRPAMARAMMALAAGNAQGDETAPDWWRGKGMFALGKDANGNDRSVSIGLAGWMQPLAGLPQMAAAQYAFGYGRGRGKDWADRLGGTVVGGIEDTLGAGVPLVRSGSDILKSKWRDDFADTKAPEALAALDAKDANNPYVPAWMASVADSVAKAMDLKPVEQNGEITGYTMNPVVKALLQGTAPGAMAAIGDLSQFAKPGLSTGEAVVNTTGVARFYASKNPAFSKEQKLAGRQLAVVNDSLAKFPFMFKDKFGDVSISDTHPAGIALRQQIENARAGQQTERAKDAAEKKVWGTVGPEFQAAMELQEQWRGVVKMYKDLSEGNIRAKELTPPSAADKTVKAGVSAIDENLKLKASQASRFNRQKRIEDFAKRPLAGASGTRPAPTTAPAR